MAWEYITAKHYPLYDMVIGDDWRELVPVYQSGGTTAFDFTGWNAFAQIRNKADGTVIMSFDSYDGTIEFDGGNMYLIADKDETSQLKGDRNYVWDCQFLDPYGYRRTLIIESTIEFIKDVSK